MKKIILLLSLLFASVLFSQTIKKGETQINIGFGHSNLYSPVYLGVDYLVYRNMSIGSEISYGIGDVVKTIDTSYMNNVFMLGINANFHFNFLSKTSDKYDFYSGFSLSYQDKIKKFIKNDKFSGKNKSSKKGVITGQIGGRYYFTEHLAGGLEFGISVLDFSPPTLKMGITYKF